MQVAELRKAEMRVGEGRGGLWTHCLRRLGVLQHPANRWIQGPGAWWIVGAGGTGLGVNMWVVGAVGLDEIVGEQRVETSRGLWAELQ